MAASLVVPIEVPMFLFLLAACDSESSPSSAADAVVDAACTVEGERTASWDDATHSNDTDPDYDYVFDRSSVLRVDVTLAADDYDSMYAELEEILGGAFGEGGTTPGGGGGPAEGGGDPQAMIEACEGLSEGEACSVDVDGTVTNGTCSENPMGDLMCMEEGGGATVVDEDPSYYPATISVDGSTWCYAGMRFKGNSTLQQTWQQGIAKLPFRLDFDRFEDEHPEVDDQRFYGFSDLSFGNNMGDDTYVRDVMASIILEDRGVPAARNRFAAVYLDTGDGPAFMGLYTMNEDPSDALPDRIWGDDDGNLYEGDGTCADLTCYDAESFAAKTNDDTADGAEVQALVDVLAAERSDAVAWRGELEEVIDVDAFLRWLAVNSAIENWDAYGNMTHNYYLYALPDDDGRLQWIPWDHNLSLMSGMMGTEDPLLTDVTEDWPLIRHVLDDEEYAAVYRGYLADALVGAYEEETFQATAEGYRVLIEEYALSEEEGWTFVESEESWDAGWEDLYTHVSDRRAEVEAALE